MTESQKQAALEDPPQVEIAALVNLHQSGLMVEAEQTCRELLKTYPQSLVVMNVLGSALTVQGKLKESVQVFDEVIQLKPDFAEAYFNRGIALNKLGLSGEAVSSYNKAIEFRPDYIKAHNNRGNALRKLGQQDEAVASFDTALQFRPDYAEAYSNRGNALRELNQPDAALASFDKAIALRPDFADGHFNRGNALRELNQPDAALASFDKAIALIPDFAEAYFNRGNVLRELDQTFAAANSYRKATSLLPDRKDIWQNFASTLRTITFKTYSQEWADVLVAMLEKKTTVLPINIVSTVLSLLKAHPSVKEALEWSQGAKTSKNFEEVCIELSNISLFSQVIEICTIPDLEVEDLLKSLRSHLLKGSSNVTEKSGLLNFQLSLALHCFVNEYIFGETDAEKSAINELESDIEKAITNNREPETYKVVCLASYKPLHQYDWSGSLNLPKECDKLSKSQITDVLREASFQQDMSCLKEVSRGVSSLVRSQYEENPYPRWINTKLYEHPTSISSVCNLLELKLVNDRITFSKKPEILIAGCGTGQHALGTATLFANSKVLAIDLSIASLSYARRKSLELHIYNIEYMQADILDLGLLNRRFDIVESVGVLHHMEDPVAGLKVLTGCLKSHGLMKIGLYSELARRDIVIVREYIEKHNLPTGRDDIIEFRNYLLESKKNFFLNKFKASDLFSTSEIRDLLFHVQEHRFTLPQIKECLETLGLSFAGFEFSNTNIQKEFEQTYTEADKAYDLEAWHNFEVNNPDSFNGMYQFWVQKIA